jgi:hypothetical protein
LVEGEELVSAGGGCGEVAVGDGQRGGHVGLAGAGALGDLRRDSPNAAS